MNTKLTLAARDTEATESFRRVRLGKGDVGAGRALRATGRE